MISSWPAQLVGCGEKKVIKKTKNVYAMHIINIKLCMLIVLIELDGVDTTCSDNGPF